jgi:hypothetical protein
MSNLVMHTKCLAKCHGLLGITWGGQKLQIKVSLDDEEDGKVSLAKTETC